MLHKHKQYATGRLTSALLTLSALVCLLAVCALPAAASPIAVERITKASPLADNVHFLLDSDKSLNIADIVSMNQQSSFEPLPAGLPASASGALWLRFSLIKNIPSVPAAPPASLEQAAPENNTLLLDLGKNIPPASIWLPKKSDMPNAKLSWAEFTPDQDNRFVLAAPSNLPMTVYLRMESVPDLWFSPQLAPVNTPSAPWLPFDLILQILLAVCLVGCLLRAIAEKAQWRFWGAVLIVCALLQAINTQAGMEAPINLNNFIFILAPGLSLMLLSHLGRHMLYTSARSKGSDLFLQTLLVPGAIIALIPLLPGFLWVARLTPLTPLLFILVLPMAVDAMLKGRPGALAFLCVSFLPMLGAMAALLELFLGSVILGTSGPLWGFAFGAVALVLNGSLAANSKVKKTLDGLEIENEAAMPLKDADDLPDLRIFAPFAERENIVPQTQNAPRLLDIKLDNVVDELEPLPLMDYLEITSQDAPAEEAPQPAALSTLPCAEEETDAPAISTAMQAEVWAKCETPEQPEAAESAQPAKEFNEQSTAQFIEQTIAPAEAGEHAQPKATASPLPKSLADQTPVLHIADIIQPEEKPADAGADIHSATEKTRREHLVIIQPEAADADDLPGSMAGQQPGFSGALHDRLALVRLENALRTQYETILRGAEMLQVCHPRASEDASFEYTELIQEGLTQLASMLDNLDRIAAGKIMRPVNDQVIFNLPDMVQQSHAEIAPLAESKGLSLSWFISPYLPQVFKGHADKIQEAITLLLFEAVEATTAGSVQLSVRPDSRPGFICFSLTDSGRGVPPTERPTTGVIRAWEISGQSGGVFALEFAPESGMHLTFSANITPATDNAVGQHVGIHALKSRVAPESYIAMQRPLWSQHLAENGQTTFLAIPAEEQAPPLPVAQHDTIEMALEELRLRSRQAVEEVTPPASVYTDFPARQHVILADMAASVRRRLNEYLEGLPYTRMEARGVDEIAGLHQLFPAGLIILDADIPETDIEVLLRQLKDMDANKNISPTVVLPLLSHAAQDSRMRKIGCAAGLPKPFTREDLREVVCRLLPLDDNGADNDRTNDSGRDAPQPLPQESNPEMPGNSPAASAVEAPYVLPENDGKKFHITGKITLPTSSRGKVPEATAPAATPEEKNITSPTETEKINIPENSAEGSTNEPPYVWLTKSGSAEIAPADAGIAAKLAADLAVALASEKPEPTQEQMKDKTEDQREEAPQICSGLEEKKVDAPGSLAEEHKRPVPLMDLIADPDGNGLTDNTKRLITLPGIETEEALDADMVPLLPGFMIFLQDALQDIRTGREESSPLLVQEGAERLAGHANAFGLFVLERIARCVERAAAADDLEAIADLSEELENVGQKYHQSLTGLHANYTAVK